MDHSRAAADGVETAIALEICFAFVLEGVDPTTAFSTFQQTGKPCELAANAVLDLLVR